MTNDNESTEDVIILDAAADALILAVALYCTAGFTREQIEVDIRECLDYCPLWDKNLDDIKVITGLQLVVVGERIVETLEVAMANNTTSIAPQIGDM